MPGRYGDGVTADENRARAHPPAAGAGRSAFLAFRFAVELVTIAVLAWAGASASAGLPVRIVLAIGAPALLSVVWGLIMAPNARRRLRDPARLAAEVAIFGISAAALAAADHALPALTYAIVALGAAGLTRVIAPEA
jgi:hypothetical protein